jgi:hypothetical protein
LAVKTNLKTNAKPTCRKTHKLNTAPCSPFVYYRLVTRSGHYTRCFIGVNTFLKKTENIFFQQLPPAQIQRTFSSALTQGA